MSASYSGFTEPRGISITSGCPRNRFPVYRLAGGWAGGPFPSCPFSDRTRSCEKYGREASPEGVRSHVTVVWWILWVIAVVLEYRLFLGATFGSGGESMEGLAGQNNTTVLVDVLFLVADALVAILVWQITMVQERRFQGLTQFYPA